RVVLLRVEAVERQFEAILPDRLAVATAVVATLFAQDRQDVVGEVERSGPVGRSGRDRRDRPDVGQRRHPGPKNGKDEGVAGHGDHPRERWWGGRRRASARRRFVMVQDKSRSALRPASSRTQLIILTVGPTVARAINSTCSGG